MVLSLLYADSFPNDLTIYVILWLCMWFAIFSLSSLAFLKFVAATGFDPSTDFWSNANRPIQWKNISKKWALRNRWKIIAIIHFTFKRRKLEFRWIRSTSESLTCDWLENKGNRDNLLNKLFDIRYVAVENVYLLIHIHACVCVHKSERQGLWSKSNDLTKQRKREREEGENRGTLDRWPWVKSEITLIGN